MTNEEGLEYYLDTMPEPKKGHPMTSLREALEAAKAHIRNGVEFCRRNNLFGSYSFSLRFEELEAIDAALSAPVAGEEDQIEAVARIIAEFTTADMSHDGVWVAARAILQHITPRTVDARGDFEARHCPGIPTDCCDFGIISKSRGREICRVWDRDDCERITALLNGAPRPALDPETVER